MFNLKHSTLFSKILLFVSINLISAACLHAKDPKAPDKSAWESKVKAAVTEAKGQIPEGAKLEIKSLPALKDKKLSEVFVVIKAEKEPFFKDFELLAFDAEMPEHDHGMVTQATKPKLLESSATSRVYHIKGVKLHMPGFWLMKVDYIKNNKKKTLEIRYELSL